MRVNYPVAFLVGSSLGSAQLANAPLRGSAHRAVPGPFLEEPTYSDPIFFTDKNLAEIYPYGLRLRTDVVGIDMRDTESYVGSAPFPTSEEELQQVLLAASAESTGGSRRLEMSKRRLEECGDQQAIYLDFPSEDFFQVRFIVSGGQLDVSFPRTVQYTDEDKKEVMGRLEADFAGYNMAFFLEKPPHPDECISTLSFTCNQAAPCMTVNQSGSLSILFGRAQGIDFLNLNRGDSAFVDTAFWDLWFQVSGPDEVAALAGLPNPETALKRATQNQAANTGAHELGHNSGLRHYDSLAKEAKFNSDPNFPPGVVAVRTDFGGTETVLRLMASGASVGLTLAGSGGQDRFFSERSAIKLALAYGIENGQGNQGGLAKVIVSEEEASSITLQPQNLILPNSVTEGTFQGGAKLQVRANVLQGSLTIPDGTAFPAPRGAIVDSDTYGFKFKKGDFVTAEAISFATTGDLITGVRIFRHKTGDVLCTNLQEFEAFDGVCFDVEIPANDVYVVEIFTTDLFCVSQGCFYLSSARLDFFEGDYDLFVYTTNKALGKPE